MNAAFITFWLKQSEMGEGRAWRAPHSSSCAPPPRPRVSLCCSRLSPVKFLPLSWLPFKWLCSAAALMVNWLASIQIACRRCAGCLCPAQDVCLGPRGPADGYGRQEQGVMGDRWGPVCIGNGTAEPQRRHAYRTAGHADKSSLIMLSASVPPCLLPLLCMPAPPTPAAGDPFLFSGRQDRLQGVLRPDPQVPLRLSDT